MCHLHIRSFLRIHDYKRIHIDATVWNMRLVSSAHASEAPPDAEVLGATWLVCWTSARGASEARAESHKRPLVLVVDSVGLCVCVFVCPGPGAQTRARIATKLGMFTLLMHGSGPFFQIPDLISRFPENGKNRFLGRQCLLWAPFSREWRPISKKWPAKSF